MPAMVDSRIRKLTGEVPVPSRDLGKTTPLVDTLTEVASDGCESYGCIRLDPPGVRKLIWFGEMEILLTWNVGIVIYGVDLLIAAETD
ncbi:hypothetical protein PHLCEN_2v3397 [Hermanssonia centrifuga]|uniref:Uncharacterized protein n=1 Tax=Hermanssonia centrifuga TaxID=98765 RepID=A0A2R6QIT9_9APHY|nr:hypothetical protein PHLCEN_2v3397 [Hermanssonia centrifuga]